MARDSGGGGAFAWTLLGFLAGIAATLGLQMLLGEPRAIRSEPAPAIAIEAPSAPAPAPPKKHERKSDLALAPSAAPAEAAAAVARPPVDAQVADDAAAAGMTSRVPPPGQPASPAIASADN